MFFLRFRRPCEAGPVGFKITEGKEYERDRVSTHKHNFHLMADSPLILWIEGPKYEF